MSLFNRKFILKQSPTDGAPTFMYTLLKLPKQSVSLLACSTASKPNTPLYTELILLAETRIQGNPTG